MTDTPAWDLLLRGAVGGVLLFHAIHLLGPGPRAAARAALILFTVSLIAYLACQRNQLLAQVPGPVAWFALALCTSASASLWLAARALFDDGFGWRWPVVAAMAGMVALGLAAHAPRLAGVLSGTGDPGAGPLEALHAIAMVAFTAAAVVEVLRGWRDDLVEPRRAARRWVALGIGAYAGVALAVELAVRDRPIGPVLPALHVLGIGAVAMALAVLVARRQVGAILGTDAPTAPVRPAPVVREAATPPAGASAPSGAAAPPTGAAAPPPEAAAPPPQPPASPALRRLLQAMDERHLYRREGLTVAALAAELGLGEAALRALINSELGHRNFNDFLHRYRLREAAARLAAEDLPILTLALESGYGSIGPFNRAFRQRYGVTPTEYRAAARLAHPAPGG
jgi:AraC-like DNA-binding protein